MKLFLSFFVSFCFHGFLLWGASNTFLEKKENFSKNNGQTEIRAIIQISENKEVKKKGNQKEKKKTANKPKQTNSSQAQGKIDQGQTSIIAKYLTEVRTLIVKHKYKSRMAKKLKLKGEVSISFIINKPNIITALKIEKSSNLSILDDSALQTVKAVEAFPIIPNALKESSIPVLFNVIYE